MSDHAAERLGESLQRQRALSRWDNEGGAETGGPQTTPHATEGQLPFPGLTDAELQALHVRVTLRANEGETPVPREFRLEGAEGSSRPCPCFSPRRTQRPAPAQTEADGCAGAGRCVARIVCPPAPSKLHRPGQAAHPGRDRSRRRDRADRCHPAPRGSLFLAPHRLAPPA